MTTLWLNFHVGYACRHSGACCTAGDGTDGVLQSVRVARAVLQVEIIRACGRAARRLDAALLKDAIRQGDLLLVHYADPRVLSSGTAS